MHKCQYRCCVWWVPGTIFSGLMTDSHNSKIYTCLQSESGVVHFLQKWHSIVNFIIYLELWDGGWNSLDLTVIKILCSSILYRLILFTVKLFGIKQFSGWVLSSITAVRTFSTSAKVQTLFPLENQTVFFLSCQRTNRWIQDFYSNTCSTAIATHMHP